MPKHELWELQSMQAAPLSVKVSLTKSRIREWVKRFGEDGVYVSFSGGKDSTVLLHLVREEYPNVPAVFVDVPTQYPELREFAKTFDNVEIVKPKLTFMQVCEKYGFPLISKEVAECVAGARKYLTSIMDETEAATDRQTDRQTDSKSHMLTGTNGCSVSASIESQESLLEMAKSILNSTGQYAFTQRIARIMGVYQKDWGKKKTGSIPRTDDRSMFSCERYQFFLDAPFEISNECCHVMKKAPLEAYARKTHRVPITAQMASESRLRTQVWLRQGCNAFDAKKKISNPMAFWTEQDVLLYIYQHHIPICSVYGEVVKENEVEGQLDWDDLGLFDLGAPALKTTGCDRTGCMLCGFGCHMEKDGESRFQRLKETHPGMYKMLDVVTNSGVTFRQAIDWTNEYGNLHIRY